MENPNNTISFQVAKETKRVALDEVFPEHHALIGAGLDSKSESELTSLLRENRDIFAWWTQDLQGVPRELAKHSLDVRPDVKAVKQPLW
jgi:hypothetical protein